MNLLFYDQMKAYNFVNNHVTLNIEIHICVEAHNLRPWSNVVKGMYAGVKKYRAPKSERSSAHRTVLNVMVCTSAFVKVTFYSV